MKKNVLYLVSVLTLFTFVNVININAQKAVKKNTLPQPVAVFEFQTSGDSLLLKENLSNSQLSIDKAKEAADAFIYNENPDLTLGMEEGIYAWNGSDLSIMILGKNTQDTITNRIDSAELLIAGKRIQ